MLIIYMSMLDDEHDKIKIEQIYRRYNGLVYSIAYKMLMNEQEAEDAMHEAFMRLTKHLHKFDDILSHKTKRYIVIVIENICRDILKKNKVPTVSFDEMIHTPPDNSDTEDIIFERVSAEAVRQAIGELSPIHKEIIVLKYAEEMSDADISNLLKISAVAVRKRLQRARTALANKLRSNEVTDFEKH